MWVGAGKRGERAEKERGKRLDRDWTDRRKIGEREGKTWGRQGKERGKRGKIDWIDRRKTGDRAWKE